jgi:arylsulfatase A-like enzyme
VPLIIRRPDEAGGVRVRSVVELVDLGPTLLELVGLADPRPSPGTSLVSQLDGSQRARAETEEEAAFSELHGDPQVTAVWRAKKHRTALTTQAWSLVAGEPRGAVELYDLAADPGQTRDRAAQQRPVLEALSQRLSAQATSVWDPQPEQRIDEQEALGLRALGYLD